MALRWTMTPGPRRTYWPAFRAAAGPAVTIGDEIGKGGGGGHDAGFFAYPGRGGEPANPARRPVNSGADPAGVGAEPGAKAHEPEIAISVRLGGGEGPLQCEED